MGIYWTAPLTDGIRRTPARQAPEGPALAPPTCHACHELIVEDRCGCRYPARLVTSRRPWWRLEGA